MSIRLYNAVRQSGLPRHLRDVAAHLATYADADGRKIFPSMRRIAAELGLTRRMVQAHVSTLRRMRILIPEGSTAGGAHAATTRYRLEENNLPSRAEWNANRRAKPASSASRTDGRTPRHPRGEADFPPRVKSASPKRSKRDPGSGQTAFMQTPKARSMPSLRDYDGDDWRVYEERKRRLRGQAPRSWSSSDPEPFSEEYSDDGSSDSSW